MKRWGWDHRIRDRRIGCAVILVAAAVTGFYIWAVFRTSYDWFPFVPSPSEGPRDENLPKVIH